VRNSEGEEWIQSVEFEEHCVTLITDTHVPCCVRAKPTERLINLIKREDAVETVLKPSSLPRESSRGPSFENEKTPSRKLLKEKCIGRRQTLDVFRE